MLTRSRAVRLVGLLALGLVIMIGAGSLRMRTLQLRFPPPVSQPQLPMELLETVRTSSRVTLGQTTPREATCSRVASLTLQEGHWLRPAGEASAPVQPLCWHLAGWYGRRYKCLVEFAATRPVSYYSTSLSAAVASLYYRLSYGGLAYFAAAETDTVFLMLDHSWCDIFNAGGGFALNEGYEH